MTPSQLDVLNKLKDTILVQDGQGYAKAEYDKFEATEFPGQDWVSLVTSVCIPGAGQLSERHYWIGPRGKTILLFMRGAAQVQDQKHPWMEQAVKTGRRRRRTGPAQHSPEHPLAALVPRGAA